MILKRFFTKFLQFMTSPGGKFVKNELRSLKHFLFSLHFNRFIYVFCCRFSLFIQCCHLSSISMKIYWLNPIYCIASVRFQGMNNFSYNLSWLTVSKVLLLSFTFIPVSFVYWIECRVSSGNYLTLSFNSLLIHMNE